MSTTMTANEINANDANIDALLEYIEQKALPPKIKISKAAKNNSKKDSTEKTANANQPQKSDANEAKSLQVGFTHNKFPILIKYPTQPLG